MAEAASGKIAVVSGAARAEDPLLFTPEKNTNRRYRVSPERDSASPLRVFFTAIDSQEKVLYITVNDNGNDNGNDNSP